MINANVREDVVMKQKHPTLGLIGKLKIEPESFDVLD